VREKRALQGLRCVVQRSSRVTPFLCATVFLLSIVVGHRVLLLPVAPRLTLSVVVVVVSRERTRASSRRFVLTRAATSSSLLGLLPASPSPSTTPTSDDDDDDDRGRLPDSRAASTSRRRSPLHFAPLAGLFQSLSRWSLDAPPVLPSRSLPSRTNDRTNELGDSTLSVVGTARCKRRERRDPPPPLRRRPVLRHRPLLSLSARLSTSVVVAPRTDWTAFGLDTRPTD